MVRSSETSRAKTYAEVRLPKDEHSSATKVGNNSIKDGPNGGNSSVKVRSKKKCHSKVPLRKMNSEAILQKQEQQDRTSKSLFDVNQFSAAVIENVNRFCVEKDANTELELLQPSSSSYKLEDIFCKEINDPTKYSENSHLLIDVIEELKDIEKTLSKPRISFARKIPRKLPRRSHPTDSQKREKPTKEKKSFGRDNNKHKQAAFCSFVCEEYVIIRPNTAPGAEATNAFCSRSEFFSRIPIRSSKETTSKCPRSASADFWPNVKSTCKGHPNINARENITETHSKMRNSSNRKHGFEKICNSQKDEHIINCAESPSQTHEKLVQIKLEKQKDKVAKDICNTAVSNIVESKASKIPRTTLNLNMESLMKGAKSGTKTNASQQQFSSKIPVGVKSSAGISANLIINDKSEVRMQEVLEMPKDQPRKFREYQVMAVPTIIYSEVAKFISERANILQQEHCSETEQQIPICKRVFENSNRMETVDESCVDLEVKKGYEDIFRTNPQFGCGDKKKSNSKLVLNSPTLHKLLRKTEVKTKSKRFFNLKSRSWLNNSKVNLKPIVSSPETRTRITLSSSVRRKLEKKSTENKIDAKKISPKKSQIEKISINTYKNSSDIELLRKLESRSQIKTAKTRKRRDVVFAIEKSIQTSICTNSMEVQVNSINELDLEEEPNRNLCSGCNTSKEESTSSLIIKPTDGLNVILDYCIDLLKSKQSLEELLLEYKKGQSTSSVEIGCQVENSACIDSFSQTLYYTVNESCQCCEERCTVTLGLNTLHRIDISKPSHESFNNKKIKKNRSLNDLFNESKIVKEVQNIPSIFLTVDKCTAPGLDRNTYRENMSCYCKEAPIDQKAKIEADRPRNLFEDEYSDEEYSECYMKELTQAVVLEDENKACGSTPSLPEVAVASDKCESKMEIPWLKISLAPPGYYEIKNMPGCPKQVVCDCWALSNGDDVYMQPVQQVYEPDCLCENAQAYTIKPIPPNNPVEPTQTRRQTAPTSVVQPPLTAPARSSTSRPEKPQISAAASAPRAPSGAASARSSKSQPENSQMDEVELTHSSMSEPHNPQVSEPALVEPSMSSPENPQTNEPENPTTDDDIPAPSVPQENVAEEGGFESAGTQKPPIAVDDINSSNSSSSIPSTCACLHERDECEDIMGRPTDFVFESACYAQHETYLDPIYKLFPDDCDTYCGPYIEMPWSELTIPRNIRLRQAKKADNRPDSKQCKCEKKNVSDTDKSDVRDTDNEIVVCGTKDATGVSPGSKPSDSPADENLDKADKTFEIQLSFTEIVGNMGKIVDRSTKSARSGRSRSKNKNSSAMPLPFGCRCGNARSPSPSKFRTIASKSSAGIDPNTPSVSSQRPSSRDAFHKYKKDRHPDPVMSALETCEAEMEPLRDSLNQLKSKIRNLNIPELSNWNSGPGAQRSGCPPQCAMSTMRPPTVSHPQNFPGMRPPHSQMPFPAMFHGMPPMNPPLNPPLNTSTHPPMNPSMNHSINALMNMPMNLPPMFPPPRSYCPCVCPKQRSRRRSERSVSSGSTEYSEYDSLSEGESLCPFLRALSSKAIYKEKETKGQRKCKTRESQTKRHPISTSKRHNKKSQADYARQDICTDTEPEIQVHYGPKRRRMKTKQVFKSVMDPNMISTKNQRLRIAVKVTPSDAVLSNDNLLAIQAPDAFSKYSDCGRKRAR